MGFHADDKRFAKKVVELNLAGKAKVQETARIIALRADLGEVTSLEHLLFEKNILSAGEVYKAQKALKLRTVFCPGCQTRLNLFKEKPGSAAKCSKCKGKVPVPGADKHDPWKTGAASAKSAKTSGRASARMAAADSSGGSALGLIASLGFVALLADAALESRGTHMLLPASASAAGFGVTAALLGRKLGALTTSALGLATVTGLSVAYAIGNAPGSRGLLALGHDAHQALAPLVALHVMLLLVAGHGLLVRARAALLLLLLPLVYGLVFFTWRSVPGTDPSMWLQGGPFMDRVPWFAHPGAVTLLLALPLGALLFLGAGLRSLFGGSPALFLRRAALAASLLFLTGFGLTVGAASGRIPHADLEQQVQTTLAGRIAPYWKQPAPPKPAKASLAVALTPSR